MEKQTLTKSEEIKRVIPLAGGRELPLSRPLVMGVLNVTPDSFSDGGLFDAPDMAVEHALRMIEQGADIIDIGGESSRPGSDPVEPAEELARVIPIVERLRQASDVCISIDTYRADTARKALDAGVDMVNDISALRFDNDMPGLLAEYKVPVVLMHMQGTPRDMQRDPQYDDCVEEVAEFFDERIRFCNEQGIPKPKIILDPGIGFGKRLSNNLELLANLDRYREFKLPLLVGASRKAFIGMLNPVSTDPAERIGGSLAAALAAIDAGADIVRVHDVPQTVEALKVFQAIRRIG
ncbi:dihydropteroate synthase [candidate division GN15 bacterium]|nr:dihydropteroate synthase [candidate division GN15 bacterium]